MLNLMRVRSRTLTVSLFLLIGFTMAGCIGADDELETDDEPEVEYKEALQTRITMDGSLDTWFEPGASLGVSAQEPENAVGNVNYTWIIQEDPFVAWTPGQQAIDTGSLAPGESGDITFDEPAFYQYAHCDPHPWMKHSVTVLDDYDGPDELTVYLLEGDINDEDSWKFFPEHITVGVGTTVTYENLGGVAHTASIAHDQENVPTPKRLGLEEREGTVTLEGENWMNVIVLVEDEEGNEGWAKQRVYVNERFPDYEASSTGEFMTSLEELENEESHEHPFDWSGTVTLNVSMPSDPSGMIQQLDVALYELDGDKDRVATLIAENETGPAEHEAEFTTAVPRTYELVVRPALGVLIEYEIGVHVEYDQTPPELVEMPCPEPHFSLGHC